LADRLAVKPSRYWSDMLPDARDLLALALPRWLAGEVLDAADAQPIYLRDKVATPKAQR
jgi:tRNA threonylcarbamoyladenosine biosynthesis protein TsaB